MNRYMIGLLGLLAFGACKKKDKLTNQPPSPTTQTEAAATTPGGMPIAIPDRVKAHFGGDFTACQGRMRLSYQDKDQRLPLTISYKMEQGRAASFVVLAPLGIPVAQGLVRPDSFFIQDKFNNKLYYGGVAALGQVSPVPVDFRMLEMMLVGIFPLPSRFRTDGVTDTTLALSDQGMEYLYVLGQDQRAPKELVARSEAQALRLTTSNPTSYVGYMDKLPAEKKVVVYEGDQVRATVETEIQSLRFNADIKADNKPEGNDKTIRVRL